MNGVQCYELFGGIALKNHAFSFSFFHYIKCTKLDELHENDQGLTIDVVPGNVRHGLVPIKLHILHPLLSHLEFPCNVEVVLLTLLWIKMRLRLRGCLYAIISGALKSSC